MPSRGQEEFTILLIPHSARPMGTMRLSSRTVQICCIALIITFMSLTVFAARYAQMVAHLHELRDLRILTQVQDEQLHVLSLSAAELGERLTQLAELDAEVRHMLKLDAPSSPAPVGNLLAATRSVSVAKSDEADGPATPETYNLTVETSVLAGVGTLAGTMDILQQEMEQRLTSLEELQVAAAEKLAYDAARPSIWPTQGIITSRYGYRSSPFGGYRQFHPAVDIAAPVGTPVVATGDARVIFTGWKVDLGNTVILDHGYNFRTLYGHVSKVAVSVGDRVKKGQVIAYVGSTGQSTGPHVHYEVHLRGADVNPAPYLH